MTSLKKTTYHMYLSWVPYRPEEAEDKSESDPFATSEDTDEEECDGENSE